MARPKKKSPNQSEAPPLQTSAAAPVTRVVVGASSGVKADADATHDPRWPYLNRWSGENSLAATIAEIERSASATKVPTPVIDSAENPSPGLDPVDILAAVLDPPPKVSNPLEEAANNPNSSGDTVPVSQAVASVESLISDQVDGGVPEVVLPQSDPANPGKEVASLGSGLKSSTQPLLKGAWAKKLVFSSPSIAQTSRVDTEKWPSLSVAKSNRRQQARETQVSQRPEAVEDDIRFPWAAKMNPASRNLYRATEPEYLEDGTPKVTIPQHVFLQGLENQKEYVLGQFRRCSPPSGGLIYAVFNKLWGRNCKITVRKLGESNYLFHIPDESTRTWVLQRGLWHVDDCLMFVASWTPEASLAIPEIKTIPVWVTLKKIPSILYSISGISHIASGLGAPMATHKPRLDPIHMGEAKILVEVELSKAFPPRIAADDKNGFISMVDVEYAWLPSECGRCGELGHKVKHCLKPVSDSSAVESMVIVDKENVKHSNATLEDSPIIVSESAQPKSASGQSTEVFPSNVAAIDGNEPNLVDPTSSIITDDRIAPGTISVFENMSASIAHQSTPTITNIIESVEIPILESAQALPVTDTPTSHARSTVQRESRLDEPDFGSNKFGSLISLEGVEDSKDSDNEFDSLDLMTPSGKRILRERPVKPSTKAKEMHGQITGRGNRGRGNRGGRG